MQYVTEHPHAMDSIEGIAEWWIMRRQVRVDVEALEKVLSQLTEKGLLERIESGEKVRYRLKNVQ
jgi:predicted transcriptional regulator of viral defense system